MDLFKRIQNLSDLYDNDGPSSTVLESRPMFNDGGMLVKPSADGSRPGYSGLEKFEIEKINNPSQEALDEISTIIDKYTKTSDVAGKEIKHLSKNGAVDKIFKEVTTKGYKRPSVAKVLFKQILDSKGITTYDNYRTNKIVFTLQDVLRKNNGDILSIKPSAVAEILPEFAIEGKKGGKGLPAFRTFLNYLEGSERLIDRSGLKKPGQIAGKPVNQIIDEMKQNFLEIKGGRARGNFTVFEETKLLEKIGLENPKATANELKKLYEKAGGNSFKERVNTLYLAKSGQVTNKTDGGKSIIDAVRSGEITNKLPDSLRNSFKTYVKDYNFARMTRFAGEATDPNLIKDYTKTANIFTKNNLEKMGVPKGLVAEHGLPISAYDRGVADESTRLKIDGFVTKEINDWKAKNFDYPVFRPGGLADKYKNACEADKPKIQAQIEEKLKLVKQKTPGLVENITFDFTNGKFTASSSTPVISNDVIPNLIKKGANINQNFYTFGKFKKPSNNQAGFISRELLEDVAKKIGSVGRKGIGIGSAGLTEALFYLVDKKNMESKGIGEQEASDQAIENLTFGFNKNKTYMNSLKKTAEDMGIDPSAFDSAQKLNVLSKQYNQNTKSVQDQVDTALLNNDQKTADNLIKNYNVYKDKTRTEYERLENDIAGRVSGGSPQIMSNAKNFLTEEQFAKPFYDMQDVAIEKLKREKLRAFPTQKKQKNTSEGKYGKMFFDAFDSLTQGAKNVLQGRIIPYGPDRLRPLQSKREKENQMLKSLEPSDLNLVNLARRFTRDNIKSADIESPILADDIENIKYENPGVFFAGGGIAKIAGDRSGAMTRSMNPDSQGLSYLFNRVKKI